MKRFQKIIIVLLLSLVAAGAAYAYYLLEYVPAQAAPEPEIQTARARLGDIRITASGSGNLVPSSEINLGFRNAGVVTEILVGVGEPVVAGQVLAKLDDTSLRIQLEQARLNLEALTSPFAIAEAEKALADAKTALEEAEYARLSQQQGYRASETTIAATQADLVLAEAKVEKAWKKYDHLSGRPETNPDRALALSQYTAAVEARDAIARNLNWYLGAPNEDDQAELDQDVAIAQTRMEAAEVYLKELKGENPANSEGLAINPDLNQLRQARLSVASAENALNNTVLYSPSDGYVTGVKAAAGEMVSTSAVITIATLDQPMVRFYLEENDLGNVAVGDPALFTFEAYPDQIMEGEIVRLEPTLTTIEGTPVIVAWATIQTDDESPFLSGLAADVEVIAGESKNTLLVPVQALRELALDSYAVFVVQPDGQLKLTPVTVGLKDFANAEIISGLKAGDVVSTGNVETR